MNSKELKELPLEKLYVEQKRINLYKAKCEGIYRKKKYELILNVDWNEVNGDRASKNLPKISNQSQRDAYIGNLVMKEKEDLLRAEAKALAFNSYIDMRKRE